MIRIGPDSLGYREAYPQCLYQSGDTIQIKKDEGVSSNIEIIKCSKCSAIITPKRLILSDFLIGGHALVEGGKLLTRDRGFYRSYFRQLEVIE